MHLFSAAAYTIPLPPGHRFPIAKYELLRQAVIREHLVTADELRVPDRVGRDDLLLVHTAEYVKRFTSGTLPPLDVRRLGLPWSEPLVERSYRSVGGTCEAADAAMRDGIAMNLAGGTHHAFPDHGEGFCVFNDVAVALRRLLRAGTVRRAAIIDLDVHQGNGTHAIFAGDPAVYTFSMHGGRNYPFRKVPGSLDIELPDGVQDEAYLAVLREALPRVLRESRAELVAYLAGADPLEHDALGRLRLTFEGLARRDAMVIESCREVGIPVVITIAGGYARDIGDSVRAHLNTVRIARAFT